MKPPKSRTASRPKPVREVPLDGASSYRSFKGEMKTVTKAADKRTAPTRRVSPDKGELSPK